MNNLRAISSLILSKTKVNKSCIILNASRKMSEETSRISLEKKKLNPEGKPRGIYLIGRLGKNKHFSVKFCVNHVTLLGRVGINPQLRGTESKPVVVFTLATNTNYRYESGEIQQKTDWHRVSVFKPNLRDVVLEYLKKGSRVYIEGKLLYGEFSDSNGVVHNTTSIVASEVVFLGHSQKAMEEVEGETDP